MKKWKSTAIPLVLVVGMVIISGCSSNPSADDLAHLDALKQEVTSLQKEVAGKQSEKANLEQQVAAKKQELSQARQDEDATRANLAKFQ